MTILERFAAMDYAPALESRADADQWLQGRDFTKSLYIDGEWRAGATDKTFATYEPASGKKLADISEADAQDVDLAVKAARHALGPWQAKSPYERARILYAIARGMQRHQRLFAVLESLDNGKPIRESRDIDVPLAIRHFLYHAGMAQTLHAQFPCQVGIGVCGQIIPWNFPLLMLSWKIAPALAAGCTLVLKPAEFTPLSSILFAEICERAGVPKGVINIVQGGPQIGQAIVAHEEIDKLAFTGSTEVGREIARATAGTGKALSLELGGKSAFIVFEDADLDSAVEGLVDGIWFNQGEVCCAGSRLLVRESIADQFIQRVKARMAKLILGDPLDKNVDIGPLVDASQLKRVSDLVERGKAEGATCWQPEIEMPASGHYFAPTLALDLSPSNCLAEEEIFGPVLAVMSFRDRTEAIELANNSRYGLAASIWSETLGLALHVAPALKAGMVWINGTNLFDASCGFGGFRESGFGREGGPEGMVAYLTPENIQKGTRIEAVAPVPHSASEMAQSSSLLDRTPKLFIGGKQVRPDGNYSYPIHGADGVLLGEAGLGSRKDIRDAVSAARAASSWTEATAYNRMQVLYYLAENLSARADDFTRRLQSLTGQPEKHARAEVEASIERLFECGSWADKFEGSIHTPPMRAVSLAMKEPLGVIALITPDEKPLLSLVAMAGAALAMGNRIVTVPSQRHALIATDLYQVLETSDVPAGVFNIITGPQADLALVLARHGDVDGLWMVAEGQACKAVEEESTSNLKRCWTSQGCNIDWTGTEGSTITFLARAVEIKNVFIPYGD